MHFKSLVVLLLALFISVHCDWDWDWDPAIFTTKAPTTQKCYYLDDNGSAKTVPKSGFEYPEWLKKLQEKSISYPYYPSEESEETTTPTPTSEPTYPLPSKITIPDDYRSKFQGRTHYSVSPTSSYSGTANIKDEYNSLFPTFATILPPTSLPEGFSYDTPNFSVSFGTDQQTISSSHLPSNKPISDYTSFQNLY